MVREDFLNHLIKGEKNQILYQYFLENGGMTVPFSTFHQALTMWVVEKPERMTVLNDIIRMLAIKFEVTYIFDKQGKLIAIL